jgi:hypothetical protein
MNDTREKDDRDFHFGRDVLLFFFNEVQRRMIMIIFYE